LDFSRRFFLSVGNESDSDLDYDDLDELVVPSDAEDDDDGGGDSDSEDDHSVASATTTMSTSSVGSNTPSLVSFFCEPDPQNALIDCCSQL
jgi:hypothetical protein